MAIKAETGFSLKDQLFNAASLAELTEGLLSADKNFEAEAYTADVLKRFPDLELKQRIDWMVSVLEKYLPNDFESVIEILFQTLPPPLDPDKTDDDFGRFIWIVPGEFVAKHGCSEEHLERSLAFLRENTKRFSMENPIRPFLRDFPVQTLAFLKTCAVSENYHVRRLASEGIRPFLPWSERVMLPVRDIIEMLDILHADQTRYVTRSVANCLNDISKIDSNIAVSTLKKWKKKSTQDPKELLWMTSHALRTLLKADHAGAMELLGFTTKPEFQIANRTASKRVALGEAFEWKCLLTSLVSQKLKITMRIDFLKANGQHAPKVFAVANKMMEAGETLQIEKQQPFRAITTRTLYTGIHYAELIVNGVSAGKVEFEFYERG